jgi:hypothetical protein
LLISKVDVRGVLKVKSISGVLKSSFGGKLYGNLNGSSRANRYRYEQKEL